MYMTVHKDKFQKLFEMLLLSESFKSYRWFFLCRLSNIFRYIFVINTDL